MEVTLRELVTIVHGMLFGGFFLMAIGGAVVMLLEWSTPALEAAPAAALLTFYRPTGPLSGVTTVAIAFWLVCWAVFAARWKQRTVALGKVSAFAFVLLALGLLLTFPPFGDLLLGR